VKEEMRESPAGMSQFGLYQSCPRKWAFKYILGYVREGDTPEPLANGSAIHEGKRVFYETFDIDEAIARAVKVSKEYADSFPSIEIQKEKLKKIFMEWYKTYGKDEREKYQVISNETQNTVLLPNGTELTIRIDQVLRERETGHIFIFDTKSTGWSLEGTINENEFKAQSLLYIASVYRSNPEWLGSFRGWITDVMYSRVNYKKSGALSSISAKCQRSPAIMYTEEQCNSFLESLTSVTSEVAWANKNFKEGQPFNACFPMNRGSCRLFNRTCPYWQICFDDFKANDPPTEPYSLDPWKKEGIIQDVLSKIKV